MKQIKFYLDFDGTITHDDVVDKVLEKFADKSWREVEKEWASGKIGSRECLSRQIALVRCTPDDLAALCREVRVDAHLVSFLQTAARLQVPVKIVSDGFDFIIRNVLDRHFADCKDILKNVPVYSNRLEWAPDGPKPVFLSEDACRHGCANCKPEVIKNTASVLDQIYFVGDGLSDRYAALLCNRVFAKNKLLKFCRENDLAHTPYNSFEDVEHWLLKNYEALKSAFVGQIRAV